MHVKPADGRAPRCPYRNTRIPPDGTTYQDHDPNIANLIRFGDLVRVPSQADADAEKKLQAEIDAVNASRARAVAAMKAEADKAGAKKELRA